ncbi:MAG: RDD family protein, partial [Gammaproteobacteria bacterium]
IFMFGLVLVVILLLGVFFGVFRRGSQSGPMTQTESLVLGLSIDLFFLIIVVVYETFMIGKFGATLGKMACRIKVVTADGGRVSYLRALGRFGGKILSNMTFYIGYIIAGFDSQKRSLHDHICGTRVIYK